MNEVRDMTREAGEAGEQLIDRASERMGAMADYIRSRDFKSMADDLRRG